MQLKDWPQFLDLIQAIKDGKTIQMLCQCGWEDFIPSDNVAFDKPRSSYRIKPEAKLREWKCGEAPLLAIVKYMEECNDKSKHRGVIVGDSVIGISLGGHFSVVETTYAYALANLIHSTDGGKTFKPCGVEETI